MVGGWGVGSQARPDSLQLPPCVCVSVPSPQSDNRAGPVPDWGQLVAAGGWGPREVGVVGIRHRCLTCVSG